MKRFGEVIFLSLLLIPPLVLPRFVEDGGLQGTMASDPDSARYIGLLALVLLLSMLTPNRKVKSGLQIAYISVLSLGMSAVFLVMTMKIDQGPSTIYDWAPRYPLLLDWFFADYGFFILFALLSIRAMRHRRSLVSH